MQITAAMVKELREATGAGMSDCKNALVAADGDMEGAVKHLREKGLAAAEKKSGRLASEGLVYTYITEDNKTGVLVEVNSETDFVAKNQLFRDFVHQVAAHTANSTAADVEGLLVEAWLENQALTVKDALVEKIGVIGENLTIRRFERFVRTEDGMLVSYIHGGGRVGVLVELLSAAANDALLEAGKNVAMQIAAMSPKFVRREDVSPAFLAEEKEILIQQTKNDEKNKNKPDNIVEKMVEGRLNKELKDFCLLEQEYVKDAELTVGKYLEQMGKQNGAAITCSRFVRFETGEGLAKRVDNFAEEVSKMMGN